MDFLSAKSKTQSISSSVVAITPASSRRRRYGGCPPPGEPPAGAGWTPKSFVTAFADTCNSHVNGFMIVCRSLEGIESIFAIGSARCSASAFGTSSSSATLR